jgi:coenzyme F420-reducing hydrogenase gamma subunit
VSTTNGKKPAAARKPTLAVWKFSSCDGCQLSLLDCEDELLEVTGAVEIAFFLEATSSMAKGPYELTLVEGSITTPHDAERIHEIRRQSKFLVTIGACATTGGIQALRNFAHVGDFVSATSTSSSRAARSTSTSCSRWSGRSSPAAGRTSRSTASASSASAPASRA